MYKDWILSNCLYCNREHCTFRMHIEKEEKMDIVRKYISFPNACPMAVAKSTEVLPKPIQYKETQLSLF